MWWSVEEIPEGDVDDPQAVEEDPDWFLNQFGDDEDPGYDDVVAEEWDFDDYGRDEDDDLWYMPNQNEVPEWDPRWSMPIPR